MGSVAAGGSGTRGHGEGAGEPPELFRVLPSGSIEGGPQGPNLGSQSVSQTPCPGPVAELIGVNVDEKLNQQEVAERLGVSPRHVRRLHDEGMPREPDMRYRWDAVLSWYVDRKQQEEVERVAGGQGVEYDEARTRREFARARMAEIELQKEEGRIVTREAHDQAHGEMLDVLRTNLLNMPGRWATDLTGHDSPRQVEAILRRAVGELLDHLSGPVADALEQGGEGLPEDFPGRSALEEAGLESVPDVRRVEDLQEIHGIGPVTAGKIRERLEDANAA